MKTLLSALISLSLIIPVWAQRKDKPDKIFSRPTIIAASCSDVPKWHVEIYEDDDYKFVYRHYGRAQYIPGFFVYSKKYDRWVEIKRLSTEHAKLGRSPSFEENIPLQVSWDYSGLRNTDYAELPLHTSGSINFPDRIVYEAGSQLYCLSFNSSLKNEVSLTQFWVLRKDLEDVFGLNGSK